MDAEIHAQRWLQLFETDPEARRRAATELCMLGIGRRTHHEPVRGSLMQAAGNALPGVTRAAYARFLKSALADRREPVQCEAIFALGEMAGAEMIAALGRALNQAGSPRVRVELLRAIGKIGGPDAFAILEKKLDEDHSVRSLIGLLKRETQNGTFRDAYREPKLPAEPTAEEAMANRIRACLEEVVETQGEAYAGFLAQRAL